MEKRGSINLQTLIIIIIAAVAFFGLIIIFKNILSALIPK